MRKPERDVSACYLFTYLRLSASWNSLPPALRCQSVSLQCFKHSLKAFLFNVYALFFVVATGAFVTLCLLTVRH